MPSFIIEEGFDSQTLILQGIGGTAGIVIPPPPIVHAPDFPQRWGSGKYMVENLLPDYYWESDFINQFFMALGVEGDFLSRLTSIPPDEIIAKVLTPTGLPTPFETIVAAWYVRLATGTKLNYWEAMLNIPTDLTIPDAVRQATILNQMQNRGQSPTVTYINGLVQRHVVSSVTQDHFSDPSIPDYNFKIRITNPRGLPANLSLIQADLNTLAPQHLIYTIVYAETDWVALANRDWATIGNVSWASMAY